MNNQLSPQITEHKMTMTYDIGNPVPGLGQAQKCVGVKLVNKKNIGIKLYLHDLLSVGQKPFHYIHTHIMNAMVFFF
jgi:hypothetical protein